MESPELGKESHSSNCKLCGATFFGQGMLFRHLIKIHKIKEEAVFCKHCDATFMSNRSLKHHIRKFHKTDEHETSQHQTNDKKEPATNEINVTTDDNITKVLQRSKKNPSNKTNLHICFCGSEFPVPAKLKWHIQTVHEGRRPFVCGLCNDSFKNKITLTKHEKLMHEIVEVKPEKVKGGLGNLCHLCGREFKQLVHLKEHINSVHENNKSFACLQCDKKFHTLRKMKEHVRYIHDNIRPHKCEKCDKSFLSRANLVTHNEVVHEKTIIHLCKICNKSYAGNTNLQRHIRLKHTDNEVPSGK